MKRFIFPFEALERLRRRRREECELALAEVRTRRDRQMADLSRTIEERLSAEEDWRKALPGEGILDVAQAAAWRGYVGALSRRIGLQTRALSKLDQEMELKRRALLEAARAEKVVERLRERRRRVWLAESGREEQAFLNEAGVAVFRRAAGASA